MVDHGALYDVFERFARSLATDSSATHALADLIEGTTVALHLAGAGVTLVEGDQLVSTTATSDRLATIEQCQERTRTGPGVDAVRCDSPVLVRDVRDTDRWPFVSDQAARCGLVAIAGVPMRLDDAPVGVLDLYDDAPRDWGDDDLRSARLVADVAAGCVANARRLEEARRTAEQLQRALDSRIVIEQAKGMLAARHRISVDAAFDRLRGHARSHQVSLRSVAEGVVGLRLTI